MDSRRPFPPVGLNSDASLYDAFQYIPGTPHNLPPNADRPPLRSLNLIGAQVEPIAQDVAKTFDAHRYARVSELVITLVTANVPQQVLQEPATRRNYLMMRNTSNPLTVNATFYISFGTDASVYSTLTLSAGQTIFFDDSVPLNDVSAMSDTAGEVLSISVSTLAF